MYINVLGVLCLYFRHNLIASSLIEPLRRWKRRARVKKRYPEIIDQFSTHGIHVIPNHLSENQCDAASSQLMAALEEKFEYIHLNDDKRIFGVEQCVEAAAWLKNDEMLAKISENFKRGLPLLQLFRCLSSLVEWVEDVSQSLKSHNVDFNLKFCRSIMFNKVGFMLFYPAVL